MCHRSRRLACLFSLLLVVCFGTGVEAQLPTPQQHFGFQPGADGELMDYEQLVGYLEVLADASPRLELREVGHSPLDRPMFVLFLSAEENIDRLERLREINQGLATDCNLGAEEREQIVAEGRVFVMATLSMHSGEVAPSQALPLFAYELASTTDQALLQRLSEVVLMIVPNHNPDGMDMVVEHFRAYEGTPYEGGSLPGVYHRYVGHDNNRDFVALTQDDTRVINRLFSTEWYPQVLVEKHQMGSTGPRYFVPPNHDPIAENISEGLWRWSAVFGSNLARDMGRDGLSGVAQHWLFDDYWPGSTETSLWKNVISFLTEAASCKVARPVFVEPTELRVRGKGLAEYAKSVNMPDPWPGGWWRLSDIVRYELSSLHSVLATAAANRTEILRFRNHQTCAEVALGRTEAPFFYLLPAAQHDSSELVALLRLLDEHGVSLYRLGSQVEVDGRVLHEGDFVVPLAQPYRPFIKEVMETQRFPVRHYTPDGETIRPYDITSWSLPLHRGVQAMEVSSAPPELTAALVNVHAEQLQEQVALPERFWGIACPATDNACYQAAFRALATGFHVSRLHAAMAVDGYALPAGSFVIRFPEGGRDQLQELLADLDADIVVLHEAVTAPLAQLEQRRIGLVESWFHDMDAGWTRFVLDTYGVPYRVLRPGDVAGTELAAEFDVLVFPDQDSDVLMQGKRKQGDRYAVSSYPPEFTKGIGKEGLQKILAFVDGGGLVISWRRSTALFLGEQELDHGDGDSETFELPVRDATPKEEGKKPFVPGAFLRVEVLQGHPLTLGMPAEAGVFSRGTPVLRTSIPNLDTDRRVVVSFPKRDLLLSGYAESEEVLANTPAMVWVRKGTGQLVLYSFNPQFRASTPATYKLLFNALLLPAADQLPAPGSAGR